MLEYILDFVYPNVCGICNKLSEDNLCRKCELNLKKYELDSKEQQVRINTKYFEDFISIFKYEDIVKRKIMEYKYEDKTYLYKFFSKNILKNEKTFGLFKNRYDIIIPVPIHKKKKQLRGYNQTELIAREIARLTIDLEYEDKVLLKIRDTISQGLLSRKERIRNVNGAFEVDDKYIEKIKGKRLILFDDVLTTGSTVNECSRILKEKSAKEILILTIAKEKRNF